MFTLGCTHIRRTKTFLYKSGVVSALTKLTISATHSPKIFNECNRSSWNYGIICFNLNVSVCASLFPHHDIFKYLISETLHTVKVKFSLAFTYESRNENLWRSDSIAPSPRISICIKPFTLYVGFRTKSAKTNYTCINIMHNSIMWSFIIFIILHT
jgi:hypothetical protein